MSQSVCIRPFMWEDDLHQISCLYAESWRAAYRDILDPEYLAALSDDGWIRHLRADLRKEAMIWLAFEGQQLVGVSTCQISGENGYQGWGEIISLYLRPTFWRQGIGRQLMQKALASLWELECRDVYLWVLVDNNRARGFYEKMGFQPSSDIRACRIGNCLASKIRYVYHFH